MIVTLFGLRQIPMSAVPFHAFTLALHLPVARALRLGNDGGAPDGDADATGPST